MEDDLLVKGKELANYTMFLVSKQDILSYVYEELKKLRSMVKLNGHVKKINELISRIRQHEISEDHMKVFDVNFERVHGDFFHRLLEISPNLTRKELRLCAFVKMDLTNKEIAPLLNISVRGVETSRYRIRKKLGVQEANFKTYLDGLTETLKVPV